MNAIDSRFESALLHAIAVAVERRGKAIRYHGELECTRDIEATGERLNIDFTGLDRFHVRISVWADAVLWIGITQPGPNRTGGWKFYDEFNSEVTELDAAEIVERFEQTIHSPTHARRFWLR